MCQNGQWLVTHQPHFGPYHPKSPKWAKLTSPGSGAIPILTPDIYFFYTPGCIVRCPYPLIGHIGGSNFGLNVPKMASKGHWMLLAFRHMFSLYQFSLGLEVSSILWCCAYSIHLLPSCHQEGIIASTFSRSAPGGIIASAFYQSALERRFQHQFQLQPVCLLGRNACLPVYQPLAGTRSRYASDSECQLNPSNSSTDPPNLARN